MKAVEIERLITNHTIAKSNFDESRNYIGMSQLHLCDVEIYKNYFNGYKADISSRLKCYKGYQMEKDLITRLDDCFGDDFKSGKSHEVLANMGMVRGHPDGYLFGKPVDIKTVALDIHVPKDSFSIPFKVRCQMQAYMYFLPASFGYVIYESRESGLIRVFEVIPTNLQLTFQDRCTRLVAAIVAHERPACSCGKHDVTLFYANTRDAVQLAVMLDKEDIEDSLSREL